MAENEQCHRMTTKRQYFQKVKRRDYKDTQIDTSQIK